MPWKDCPPSDTQPGYPGHVELFCNVKGFLETWMYHPDPRIYAVVAAWILHTWHYRKFRTSPPLLLLGPIKSGKTTVLECLEELAYRAVRGGSMGNSAMFRLNQMYGPTFLLDEAQILIRDEWAETQAFLNERYRIGGKVWRVDSTDKGFIPRSFDAYGPTALALSESPWEAMISRAIVVSMEKGKSARRTLTDEFFEEGKKLRAWLQTYAEAFDPLHQPVYEETVDSLTGKPLENWFPTFDLSQFEDGRIQEKIEPLLAVAPIGGPRENILSFARDLERKETANENTSYLVEYLQAYLAALPFKDSNSIVGTLQIRIELARMRGITRAKRAKDDPNGQYVTYEEPDPNAKGMPKSRYVTKCMDTLGFERARLADGNNGFQSNSELENRLKSRYRLSPNDSNHSNDSAEGGT